MVASSITDSITDFVPRQINWRKADPNSASHIVMQAGIPTLNEGDPGTAKSSTYHQLAEVLGRELLLLIGSTHAPEDFAGIPYLSECKQFFEMKPPKFAERMTRPKAILMCDEINTSGQHVQAAQLSMLTERRLGDIKIHADTMFVACCNPVDQAPNAAPLAKSMLNRFWHSKWKHNFETFAEGMITEDNKWGTSEFPVVAPDFKRFRPRFGSLIVTFLKANTALRLAIPKDDDTRSFPTPRTWTYLRDALCAAESCNAPANIQLEICKGMVGDQAAQNFMRHLAIADLIDPESVLEGKETFTYDKKRPDLAVCLLPALITAVKSRYTAERMERAVECFVSRVGEHQRDLVYSQLRHLAAAKPAGQAMTKRSMELIASFANKIPAELRTK